MKHAIMVIGSGNSAEVLQKTINHLDDNQIDFYIHWDKKFKKPLLNAKHSKIIFIKSRKVRWGSGSLVFVEQDLLKKVFYSSYNYDYVHLISSTDIPLMTKEYFKTFFTNDMYLGFVPQNSQNEERIKYYYPTEFITARGHIGKIIIKAFKIINEMLGINRLSGIKNVSVGKGCQWFSLKSSYVKQILDFNNMEIFKNSLAPDELYLQTILNKYKPDFKYISNQSDDCKMAARYIDWKRGAPYVFTKDNVNELRNKINTSYAFARKVFDPSIVDAIFDN